MAFSREDKLMFDRLNKKLDVWKKNGVSNNAVRNVEQVLQNAYLDMAEQGYNIKGSGKRFTMRSDLTPGQEEELRQIAKSAERQHTLGMGYYRRKLSESGKKAYDKAVEKGYVQKGNQQAFINFVDFMNNAQAVKEAVDTLGSKVIARIYGYGKDNNLNSDEISDLIVNNYGDFKNGDMLEVYIKNVIDEWYSND